MMAESFRLTVLGPRLLHFFRYKHFNNKCFCTSPKEEIEQKSSTKNRDSENFRFKYHDFLPWVGSRNAVREKLERRDMLRRRNVVNLPEFYVGSILAVTTSNQHASNKSTRFVGICIMKQSAGLSSQFLLRNIVDHQGVEILYRLYSPVIQKIEVLRLEKRLDEELFYLRDAPNEYSEFPFDMQPEHRDETQPVPINLTKVKINPRPWLQRYERMALKGVELPELPEKFYIRAKQLEKPWEKYDLMDHYRKTIPEEEQKDIFNEICEELRSLELKHKIEKRKKIVAEVLKKSNIF